MEAEDSDQLEPGTVLPGGYVIEELLVNGQVNTAYVARSADGERVAAHVLHRALVDDMGDWFQSGVMLRRSLHHPALPRTLGVGFLERNRPVEITELLEGETFRELIDNRSVPFAPAAVARIVREIASALEYLHMRVPPVVHRALMPEYIFLSAPDGQVKLLGVGMADRPRFAVRRPPYQSPEELAGVSTFTPRTDVFSLATLTFEMLTGHPAFSGTAGEVLTSMNPASLPSVQAWRSELSPAIDAVLHRAWSLTPDMRPVSATEFAAEIGAIFGVAPRDAAQGAEGVPPTSRVVVVRRRHSVLGDHTPVELPRPAPADESPPPLASGARSFLERVEPTQVGVPSPAEGALAQAKAPPAQAPGASSEKTDPTPRPSNGREPLPMPKLFHRQVTAPNAVPVAASRPSSSGAPARVARVRTGSSRSMWSWDKEKAAVTAATGGAPEPPRSVVPSPQPVVPRPPVARLDHTHDERTVPDLDVPASIKEGAEPDTAPDLANAAQDAAQSASHAGVNAAKVPTPAPPSQPDASHAPDPSAAPPADHGVDVVARDSAEDTTRIETTDPTRPAPEAPDAPSQPLAAASGPAPQAALDASQAPASVQTTPDAPVDDALVARESTPSVRSLPSPVPAQADITKRVAPLSSGTAERFVASDNEPTTRIATAPRQAAQPTPAPQAAPPSARAEAPFVPPRPSPRSRRPEDIAPPDEPTTTVRRPPPEARRDRSNVYAIIAAALIANAVIIAGIAYAIASVSEQHTVIERVIVGPCPQCPVCPPPASAQPVAPVTPAAPVATSDAGTTRPGRTPRAPRPPRMQSVRHPTAPRNGAPLLE